MNVVLFIFSFLFSFVKSESFEELRTDYYDSFGDSRSKEIHTSKHMKPTRIGDVLRNDINSDNNTSQVIELTIEDNETSNEVSDISDGRRLIEAINTTPKLSPGQLCDPSAAKYYSYTVSIQKEGSHHATGVIVHKRWILTTAAQFYYIRETIKLYRVRIGSIDNKNDGIIIPIVTFEIHPLFVKGDKEFDLGLLRLAESIEFGDVLKPIRLSTDTKKLVRRRFLTSYWPRIIMNGTILPPSANERVKQHSMRVSSQYLIQWDRCSVIMKQWNYTLAKSSMCLKPILSYHTDCMPDAGSPVTATDGLWGITSGWTMANCSKLSPVIATKISSALVTSWLDSIIQSDI